jgi:Cytochrome bd terminal oxidase subunit I
MAYLADAGDPAQLLPAREQMAFTLGFHIILVPFGVAFTFLMLVANYRGLRRHDDTAMLLAERWSRVAAVLFRRQLTDRALYEGSAPWQWRHRHCPPDSSSTPEIRYGNGTVSPASVRAIPSASANRYTKPPCRCTRASVTRHE